MAAAASLWPRAWGAGGSSTRGSRGLVAPPRAPRPCAASAAAARPRLRGARRPRPAAPLGGRHPGSAGAPVCEELARNEGADDQVTFEVDDTIKERLDALLSDKYQQSRQYFVTLIEKGAVLVNGQVRKKSFRGLRRGDEVEVRFLPNERTLALEPELVPFEVLHEDSDLLIVNKPPGLVVHPGPGHRNGTLLNGVLHHLGVGRTGAFAAAEALPAAPDPSAPQRPGVVHRLDVGTSGVMAVAKTDMALTALMAAFASRQVRKTYLAVTFGSRAEFCGHSPGHGHMVDLPVGRCPVHRTRMAVVPEAAGGRSAVSFVRQLAHGSETALLEVAPRSGRTHQIRVHLAAMRAPILGDLTYGSEGGNGRHAALAARPLLHAHRLAFAHPRSGEPVEFAAPVPEDIRAAARVMRPSAGAEGTLAQMLGTPLGGALGAGDERPPRPD